MNDITQNSNTIKILKLSQLDASLSELTLEAKRLFDLLDACSLRIRTLEEELQNIKANFPFRLKIHKSGWSYLKKPLDKHLNGCAGIVNGFHTEDVLYLSWQADSSSKVFRLMLVAEEVEYILFDYAEYIQQTAEFCLNIKWQKPFIETDIKTRLQYSEYLIPFITAFKDNLHTWRKAIYVDEESFFDDDLPF